MGRVHDLGGHDVARDLWTDYFVACNAVIYLVDCNDRERFLESKAELDKLRAENADLKQALADKEAELAAIQASRKAAEAELKAAQAAANKAKGGVSLPSPTLPSISLPSAPKFDLTSSGKDARGVVAAALTL